MPQSRTQDFTEIQDQYGDWIRFAESTPWWNSDSRRILVRLYEVLFRLSEVTTRQYVMTTCGRDDAVRRLKAQYSSAKVRVLRCTLIALSWQWLRDDGSGSEPYAHDNVTGRTVDRGYHQWWTGDLLAASRRVASGKLLDSRVPKKGTPQTVAGWAFKDVRRILRQDRGEGFVLQDVAQVFPADWRIELSDVIKRLNVLGYLVERSAGWWHVTRKGKRLRRASEGRFSRMRALELVTTLKRQIGLLNADPKYLYKVETAVVFGSALDKRERVGDVDVAIQFVRRHANDDDHKKAYDATRKRAPGHLRQTFIGDVTWPLKEVERALLAAGRGRISMRDLDELATVFRAERRPPNYKVIFGSWIPPKRSRRKRVSASRSAIQLMQRLVGGRAVKWHREAQSEWCSLGRLRIDKDVLNELKVAGALKDREPSGDAELVTDEWVLSAAGHAALQRGFFWHP